jgi:hypothetical protein
MELSEIKTIYLEKCQIAIVEYKGKKIRCYKNVKQDEEFSDYESDTDIHEEDKKLLTDDECEEIYDFINEEEW